MREVAGFSLLRKTSSSATSGPDGGEDAADGGTASSGNEREVTRLRISSFSGRSSMSSSRSQGEGSRDNGGLLPSCANGAATSSLTDGYDLYFSFCNK